MPHRNRVTPEGEIVAVAARGGMYGNRGGCFHRDDQTLKPRPFATKQWICCVLQFNGRRRRLLQPGLFTELFFLDEATAMAAGHRPCFECRRADAERFAILWNEVRGKPGRAVAPGMDDILHAERIDAHHAKVVSRATLGGLPVGAFVRTPGGPALFWGGQLWPWSFAGYGAPQHAPADKLVAVLTPPSIVAILAAGFRPNVHETLNAPVAT
jgi:hypothetical protein